MHLHYGFHSLRRSCRAQRLLRVEQYVRNQDNVALFRELVTERIPTKFLTIRWESDIAPLAYRYHRVVNEGFVEPLLPFVRLCPNLRPLTHTGIIPLVSSLVAVYPDDYPDLPLDLGQLLGRTSKLAFA